MNKFIKNFKLELFPLTLILILVFSRLVPHPPNFTPIIAAAVMSVYFFKSTYLSSIVIISSMILSDLIIGFYSNFIFVYISLLLIVLIFSKINKEIKLNNLFIYGFCASLIFFIITNFGTWIFSGMYEKNLNGLIYCYFLAIPFFTNTVLSTIFFLYSAFFLKRLNFQKKIS